jgi:hypothetical protein
MNLRARDICIPRFSIKMPGSKQTDNERGTVDDETEDVSP